MDILASIKSAGTETSLFLQKKSPEILMGVGAVTFVGAIVSACVATVKAVDLAEDHKNRIENVKNTTFSEDDEKKEIAKVYLHTGVKAVKLYAPTVILSATSLGMMFGANKVLKERNAAIASSYAALSAAYKKYRDNVIEKYGEQEDYNLRHGIKEVETEEEYVDSKGNIKTKKVKANVVDPLSSDLYTRYFTKKNIYWKDNDDLTLFEFNVRENILNENLIRKGFVSFNEALELYGFDRCDDGLVVGWIYDKERPTGDNYISVSHRKEKIINELGVLEDVWVLDFNVDGNIYDIMQSRKLEAKKRIALES